MTYLFSSLGNFIQQFNQKIYNTNVNDPKTKKKRKMNLFNAINEKLIGTKFFMNVWNKICRYTYKYICRYVCPPSEHEQSMLKLIVQVYIV